MQFPPHKGSRPWQRSNFILRYCSVIQALEFVQELGLRLHSMKASSKDRKLQLHLVIPPPSDNKRDIRSFSATDMTVLESSIDGLSLMTYDYSSANQPGPNAPTPWISYCLQHLPTSKEDEKKTLAKVLLGLNFYGNDYKLPQGMIQDKEYIYCVSIIGSFEPKLALKGRLISENFRHMPICCAWNSAGCTQFCLHH